MLPDYKQTKSIYFQTNVCSVLAVLARHFDLEKYRIYVMKYLEYFVFGLDCTELISEFMCLEKGEGRRIALN